MPANLENSAVATGLEKVRFHSSPKGGQCQRMFKLPHNCTHFPCSESSKASTVCELRTSRCSSWIQKRHTNQGSNCQHPLDHRKSKRSRETYFCFTDYAKAFDCVDHNKLWKILKEMGIPDHLTCLLRNLYGFSGVYLPSTSLNQSNSQNWTWNNRLVPNRKRSTSRLYIVILLI